MRSHIVKAFPPVLAAQPATRHRILTCIRRNTNFSNLQLSAAFSTSRSAAICATHARFDFIISSKVNETTTTNNDDPAIEDLPIDDFKRAVKSWPNWRLEAYLKSRNLPVPTGGSHDDIVASVSAHANVVATSLSICTFETWNPQSLRNFLENQGKKIPTASTPSRIELLKQAQDQYKLVSKTPGTAQYTAMNDYLIKQADVAGDNTFSTWSVTDIQSFLGSLGSPIEPDATPEGLRIEARRQHDYFKSGSPQPPNSENGSISIDIPSAAKGSSSLRPMPDPSKAAKSKGPTSNASRDTAFTDTVVTNKGSMNKTIDNRDVKSNAAPKLTSRDTKSSIPPSNNTKKDPISSTTSAKKGRLTVDVTTSVIP